MSAHTDISAVEEMFAPSQRMTPLDRAIREQALDRALSYIGSRAYPALGDTATADEVVELAKKFEAYVRGQ